MRKSTFFRRAPLRVILFCVFVSIPASIVWAKIKAERNIGRSRAVAAQSARDPQPLTPGMIFTVTKTADTNDGVCDADCSLREAIAAANANLGLDTIAFHIGSGLQTIFPTSVLPTISDPVVIDGTTQPGFSGAPLIELDGTNAGDVWGLNITAGNSTIRGLIISGFRYSAIQLYINGNNLIAGNYVGTNAAGSAAHPGTRNNGIGITVATSNNVIGGTTAADRNIISGNKNDNGSTGMWIQSAATGNKVIGNYIGTDVTGTVVIQHNNFGVLILQNASANIIGGSTAGERNIFAGSTGGTAIGLTNASSNKVMGNLIGVNAAGAKLQGGTGVDIDGSSHDNLIGGLNPGEGNVIAYHSQRAVQVSATTSLRNAIIGNSMYSNSFGIDLGNGPVTPNDLNDVDTGPNNFQNFPLITSATPSAASTAITGTLNSVANTQYRIELFSSPTCTSYGYGEGKTFLAATNLNLATNDGTFNLTAPAISQGMILTATATDSTGNTSEFSPCFVVGGSGGTLQFSAPTSSVAEGGTANLIVKRVGSAVGAASVHYQMNNNTALAGDDYVSSSGTLNWADGDSSDRTISVPTVNDALDEANETLNIQLQNPSGAILGNPSTTTLSITDDDPTPTLSIANISQVEGNNGTTSFIFVVTLSAPSGQSVSVNYSTVAGGTATLGNDYQSASGVITIGPGDPSGVFGVSVNGDTQDEPNETFNVNLSNPTNATIQVGQATGTIINDDSVGTTTIQFDQSSYSAKEDLSALTITVVRFGNTSGASAVSYATNDGTATQKSDFEYAAGRLNFGPGETSKTFVLLLNEDMYVEGNESLNLVLSDPSGASLGPLSTANVVITDDSPESQTDPIDDARAFVYMNYHDFLNREPDSNGLNFWTDEIASCGEDQLCVDAKRTNVSAAFFLSIEFQETGYLVYKTYKAAYGNLPGAPVPVRLSEFFPDTQEIGLGVVVNQQGWQQVLDNNKQAFMLDFVQRSRFMQAYPNSLQPAQFVDQMFGNANVVPTFSERQDAIQEFGNAVDSSDINARARVLRRVAEHPTLSQQEFNSAFVLMQYFGYLRRNPNDAPEAGLNYGGFNFWLNKLNQFNGDFVNAEMVKAFIVAGEYRQRFGF